MLSIAGHAVESLPRRLLEQSRNDSQSDALVAIVNAVLRPSPHRQGLGATCHGRDLMAEFFKAGAEDDARGWIVIGNQNIHTVVSFRPCFSISIHCLLAVAKHSAACAQLPARNSIVIIALLMSKYKRGADRGGHRAVRAPNRAPDDLVEQ